MKTNIKAYLNIKISGWYENAKIDYDVNGRFVDAITDGTHLEILWEEEGQMYHMEFNWYTDYTFEDIYNIWMETSYEWEKVA